MSNKVSVILCCKEVNGETRDLLKSFENQTFQNFELVLVYFAIDESIRVALENNPRVKLVRQEEGKLSDARNLGMKAAEGEFITFVDGDDRVSDSYLEKLLEKMDGPVDCVFSLPELVGNFTPEEHAYFSKIQPGTYEVDLSFVMKAPVVAWGKLFKKLLIDKFKIVFPENVIFEDNYLHWTYLSVSKKVCVLEEKIYFHNYSNNSLMRHIEKECRDEGLDNLTILNAIIDFMKEHNQTRFLNHKLVRKYYLDAKTFVCEEHREKVNTEFFKTIGKLDKATALRSYLSIFKNIYFRK